MPVFRYRATGFDVTSLDGLLPVGAVVTVAAQGPDFFLDLDAPNSAKADLDDVLSSAGFTFVSQDPSDTPSEAGSASIDYASISGTPTTITPTQASDITSNNTHRGQTNNPHSTTAAQVGADPTGTAATAVATHEGLPDPHPQYTTAVEAAAAAPVQSVNGQTGAVVVAGPDANVEILGSSFVPGEDTLTSTGFEVNNTLAVNVTPAQVGAAFLLVTYMWSVDTTNNDFRARVLQNSSQLGQEHRQEPKDSGGSGGGAGTDQRHAASRLFPVTLSVGTETFELEFQPSGNYEASIFDSVMLLFRNKA